MRAAKIENGKVTNIIVVESLPDGYVDATGAKIGDDWNGSEFSTPVASLVPDSVTRMQAKTALHMAGLLTSIQTFMDDPGTDPIYKIAWDEAQTFDRNSQTIAALQATLGLTDDQIDDLFRQASTITA